MREERGCGLANAGRVVGPFSELCGKYTEHKGKGKNAYDVTRYKYELTECSVSVMHRHRVAFAVAALWAQYGQSPLDPQCCGLSLWSKVARLRDEAQWYANKV